MAIEFNCSHCNKLLKTPDDKAGRGAKCPGCGEMVTVPAGEQDAFGSAFEELEEQPAAVAAASGGGETKLCPVCGEEIKAAAVRCKHCGEDFGPARRREPVSHLQPNRGGLILAFGILSWFTCPVLGIVAWVMGNGDLQEMRAGRMDPSGEGLTTAGKILGMVCAILTGVGILCWIAFFVMMLLAAAA